MKRGQELRRRKMHVIQRISIVFQCYLFYQKPKLNYEKIDKKSLEFKKKKKHIEI